jgi:hypothetical protein
LSSLLKTWTPTIRMTPVLTDTKATSVRTAWLKADAPLVQSDVRASVTQYAGRKRSTAEAVEDRAIPTKVPRKS